ncbi:reverse transcriptase domain-containing protein [Tanacetum coccineum]
MEWIIVKGVFGSAALTIGYSAVFSGRTGIEEALSTNTICTKDMTEAESNYTTTEKEMLAVVYAFEKFRSYLIMNKSVVYTDHSALKYLFNKKERQSTIASMFNTSSGI